MNKVILMRGKIILIWGLIILFCIFVPHVQVFADSTLLVSSSASSLNIGDTVTITANPKGPNGENVLAKLMFQYDNSKFSFVSCSDSTYGGGDGTVIVTGEDTAYIVLKAISDGNSTVSVTGEDFTNKDSGIDYAVPEGGIKGAISVTINNAVSVDPPAVQPQDPPEEQPQNPPADPPAAPLSADNSLSSLILSEGTLSPAFKYNVVNYTAAVGHDVTDIVVSAKVSNEKATIESVTGNKNLKVGENRIQIVVKAENGVKATYTIKVTRLAEGETDPSAPGESESETETESESGSEPGIPQSGFSGDGTFSLNGQVYMTASEIPENIIPEGFTMAEITFSGIKFPALQSELLAGDYLIYLLPKQEDGNVSEEDGIFTVYDTVRGVVYSYVTLSCENDSILVCLPAAELIPEGFTELAYTWEDKGTFYVYQNDAELTQGFYLIYAKDQMGADGWYRFDSVYGTYQRYVKTEAPVIEPASPEPTEDLQLLQSEMQDLQNRLAKAEKQKKGNMLALAALALLLVLVAGALIIVLIVKGKESREYEEADYYDEDDEYNEDEEDYLDEERPDAHRMNEHDNEFEEEGIDAGERSGIGIKDDAIEAYDLDENELEDDGIETYDLDENELEDDGIETYDLDENELEDDEIKTYDLNQNELADEEINESGQNESEFEKDILKEAYNFEEGETDEDLFNENDLEVDQSEEVTADNKDMIAENETETGSTAGEARDTDDDDDLEFIDLDKL